MAEEARVTAEVMGHRADALYDVGVAGLHRLLRPRGPAGPGQRASSSSPAWKGRCPAWSAGWSTGPVIAVPTSVGYGASFGGIAALLAMLNSCAAGRDRRQHRQRLRRRLHRGDDQPAGLMLSVLRAPSEHANIIVGLR